MLQYFVASRNRLMGRIDQVVLLSRLRALILHTNRFTGVLPSFASHRQLKHLTLFGNRLGGQLVLPTAGRMTTLYAHNNRLSCPVIANGTTVDNQTNLIVPGNALSESSLPWMRMGGVGFLFAQTTWNRWQWTIAGLAIGSVATLVSLTWCWLPEAQAWSHTSWTGALLKVVVFQPQGDIQRLQLWTAKVLAVWSVVELVLLCPTFFAGAHFFECEEGWLQGTLAYLWNSPVAEGAGAVTACLLAAMWSASIRMLEASTFAEHAVRQEDSHGSITWGQAALLLALWLPVTGVLSIPSSFYGLTQSLPPGENVIGIGQTLIDVSHYSIGIVVFIISGYVVPKLARKMVQFACSRSPEATKAQISGRLMMAARLILVVLAPSFTVLLTNQGCFAKWLILWTPCEDALAFSTNVTISMPGTPLTLPITTHQEICTPAYVADGRCPRALIQTLADLYIKKLAFSVYLAPLINLLKSTAKGRAAKEWVMHTILRKPDYRASKSLAREVVGVVMMMELPIILGFSVPIVTLLACLGTTFNAFVFHTVVAHMDVELTDEIKASSYYLWLSLALGCTLPSWMYLENNLHGRWLVVVGMPLSAVCGAFAGTRIMRQSAMEVRTPSLREPLMDNGDLSTEGALLEAL